MKPLRNLLGTSVDSHATMRLLKNLLRTFAFAVLSCTSSDRAASYTPTKTLTWDRAAEVERRHWIVTPSITETTTSLPITSRSMYNCPEGDDDIRACVTSPEFGPTLESATPTEPVCSITCSADTAGEFPLRFENRLPLAGGNEYNLTLESTVTVAANASGTYSQEKTTVVLANVTVSALDACNFLLTVTTVVMSENDEILLEHRTEQPAHFSLKNGKIQSFCINKDDPVWTANTKRAILSMLQKQESSSNYETDMFGTCPTKLQTMPSGIVRTKNIMECKHPKRDILTTYGTTYSPNPPARLFNLPEVHQRCEQKHSTELECIETFGSKLGLLWPSFIQTKTKVTSNLKLKSVSWKPEATFDSDTARSLTPASLQFDHRDLPISALEKLLQDFCSSLLEERGSNFVGKCQKLGAGLTRVTSNDLLAVLENINNDECRSEDILLCITLHPWNDAAISFLAKKAEEEPSGYYCINVFIASIVTPSPGTESLKAALPLTDKFYCQLSASSLAYRYCKLTNPDCARAEEYKAIVDKIAEAAKTHCFPAGNSTATEEAVNALEALGNVEHLTSKAADAITTCIENGTPAIKIAASLEHQIVPVSLILTDPSLNIASLHSKQ